MVRMEATYQGDDVTGTQSLVLGPLALESWLGDFIADDRAARINSFKWTIFVHTGRQIPWANIDHLYGSLIPAPMLLLVTYREGASFTGGAVNFNATNQDSVQGLLDVCLDDEYAYEILAYGTKFQRSVFYGSNIVETIVWTMQGTYTRPKQCPRGILETNEQGNQQPITCLVTALISDQTSDDTYWCNTNGFVSLEVTERQRTLSLAEVT